MVKTARQEYHAAYYQRNKDRISAKNKEWRAANLDRHRDLTKAWREANPEKMREYIRQYKLRNPLSQATASAANQKGRIKYTQELKVRLGCIDCGYNERPEALDFDHVRGEKLFNISAAVWRCRQPWTAVLMEIDKCDIVCANCHRIRTSDRRTRV